MLEDKCRDYRQHLVILSSWNSQPTEVKEERVYERATARNTTACSSLTPAAPVEGESTTACANDPPTTVVEECAAARPAKIADGPPTTVVERQYTYLSGWDPVSRAVIDFKLDVDSVSDATII